MLSRIAATAVSVPLRGKGSVEPHEGLPCNSSFQYVSVPLRGKGSVEHAEVVFSGTFATGKFPSPCGERVLLNMS